MHDFNEYPGYPRCHAWFVNETLSFSGGGLDTAVSPVFAIDRGMGISSTVTPPSSVGAGGHTPDEAGLFRTIPIGNRVLCHFAETGAAAALAPSLIVLAGCLEDVARLPIVVSTTPIPLGGVLLLDTAFGFPYVQFEIVNPNPDGNVVICGAARVLPA